MDAREVRDALVAKNVRQASERMRKRSPSTEHFSYTKDEVPSPEPARGRRERLPIGGPGALTAATTWLAPAGTRIEPEDVIENAIQALKEGGR